MTIDWEQVQHDLEDMREKVINEPRDEYEEQIYKAMEHMHWMMSEIIDNGVF